MKTLQLPTGAGSVRVTDCSGSGKWVVVSGLPFGFPEDLVCRFFQKYGCIFYYRENIK